LESTKALTIGKVHCEYLDTFLTREVPHGVLLKPFTSAEMKEWEFKSDLLAK